MRDTVTAAEITDLVLEVFRLNGRLIAAGDALVGRIGLTSARWQVLGAIALQARPLPVVRIADAMGLARQSVQRIIDALAQDGMVVFRENPHHKRAKLVALTAKGQTLYRSAMRLQKPWAGKLAGRLDAAALATTLDVLKTLRVRLETARTGDRP